ncbi:MAG TPA: hypothetical protein VFL55_22015 [Acetobacteraceae bacterium]|nr:hypothetical protein [Acetobacteraceae bacterium]
MQQIAEAVLYCGLFLISGVAGLVLHRHLPERHRNRETLDFVRLVVGALVTFLAIVLGLLTAAAQSHFDNVGNTYRRMGGQIVQLDDALRETGAAGKAIRAEMRSYLAAVIASTWPDEPAPSGTFLHGLPAGQAESTELSALLRRVQAQIEELDPRALPSDAMKSPAMTLFQDFITARWAVIETDHRTIPPAFYGLMLFWMALMFMGFGLCAPRTAVAAVTVLICAISLASVVYVILELDDSSSGLIAISSDPLRQALADLDRP